MPHSGARSPVPWCKISTATLPIFSWDHWVNSACDFGEGLRRSQTSGMLFMNPAPFPVNGNLHTVFRRASDKIHVLEALVILCTAIRLGAVQEHLSTDRTSKGGRGVSQLSGSDMLTLYTSPSSLATRTLSLATQLTRCMSKR